MKLLLDMQGAQSQSRYRGIGRYTLELGRAMATRPLPGMDLHFALNMQFGEAADAAISALGPHADTAHRLCYRSLEDVSFVAPSNEVRRHAAEAIVAHAFEQSGADVVWYSSVVEGYHEDVVIPARSLHTARSVATLYDLIPLHEPDTYLNHPRLRHWYDTRVKTLMQCDLLLAISEWARTDAIDRLGLVPERVVNIGAGVDPLFRPPAIPGPLAASLAHALGVRQPYVLYNGGLDPRKNVPRLIEAFARLPENVRNRHQLVIVGRTSAEQMATLSAAVRKAGLPAATVIFAGYVSDQMLVELYARCALFVFPSLLEGFGLSPLEAMSCGAAVLSSRAASLAEVVGCEDAMFDPTDALAMSEKMRQGLEDPGFNAFLRHHGKAQSARFSWQDTAARAYQAIDALPDRRMASARSSAITVRASSVVCLHSGRPPGWVEAIRGLAKCEAAELPGDISQASDALRLQLVATDHIVYALPLSDVWRMPSWLQAWPGTLVIEHDAEPLHSGGSALFRARYRAGGYAACLDPLATIPLRLGERCLGVVFDEGCSPTALSIDPAVPHDCFSPATHPDRLISRLLAWRETSAASSESRLLDELAGDATARLADDELAAISDAIVAARPSAHAHRWLIDVSQIARNDLGTGVQRVVRSVLRQWLLHPPLGIRIEPVAFVEGHFRFARRYTLGLMGIDAGQLDDDFVAPALGDQYVGLDWSAETMAAAAPVLQDWHRLGVGMHFVVHDLLPLSQPEAFHPFARELFLGWLQLASHVADAFHCVSRATASELEQWLGNGGAPFQFGRQPAVDCFPLGVEITTCASAPGELPLLLADAMAARPSLLMVGTLEPRKAHAQALGAAEHLWNQGVDVNLVIVGRYGWLVEDLARRLEQHPEQSHRLFWLRDIGDPALEAIYRKASVLLAPSLGEGFGLPLVEAAQRSLPVIARDLPVFREVMGDYPVYFQGQEPGDLARVLAAWLGNTPPPAPKRDWPNWAQSAQTLAAAIQKLSPG
ncbi:hypothetical protein ATSB10_36330 [Dyella thiooxydans]|uniref:Glycosyl transferase family 1 domain-containing protein n=1 Tax=Dyella thiooxydans TaxID=445710 RepID=A0A160N559_9GAMM|nr:glycosyltransferase family 1 protein [Dyella thiooxydans]AND71087.1 hypothetical protein ATSB10_36330 [Dyella thiooxydans]